MLKILFVILYYYDARNQNNVERRMRKLSGVSRSLCGAPFLDNSLRQNVRLMTPRYQIDYALQSQSNVRQLLNYIINL